MMSSLETLRVSMIFKANCRSEQVPSRGRGRPTQTPCSKRGRRSQVCDVFTLMMNANLTAQNEALAQNHSTLLAEVQQLRYVVVS